MTETVEGTTAGTTTIGERRKALTLRPFFTEEQERRIQLRWDDIQPGFVDNPREAVEAADRLVGDIIEAIAEAFRADRAALSGPWSHPNANTETLRSSLQEYKHYIERLLGMNR